MRISSLKTVFTRGVFAAALLSLFACVPGPVQKANAEDHIVTSQDMQQQVQQSAVTRQQNIDTLNKFLATPEAEQAMEQIHADATQVKTALPTLSDAELANLSSRVTTAQQQFQAGGLGGFIWLIIVLAIVIIIVAAVLG